MADKGQGRAILGKGASSQPQSQEPPTKTTFQLNADAQEFVPKSYQPVDLYQNHPGSEYAVTNQNPLEQLRQAIIILTSDPASFDQIMGPLAATLDSAVSSEQVLLNVVEDLFHQAVSEANFRYTGARMCNYLCHNMLVAVESGNFRQHLLKRCHTEHKQREVMVQNLTTQSRLMGFALFMGELLLSMTDNKGGRLGLLVQPIEELLSTLLTQPKDAHLKCVAQVLKLTGAHLDLVEKGENENKTPKLDAIIDKMKKLLVDGDYPRSLKNLLLSVVELRASDWGAKITQIPASHTFSQPPTQHEHYGDEPVFYDEHGQPIPYEESVFMPDYYSYGNEGPGDYVPYSDGGGGGGEWAAPNAYNNMYNGGNYGNYGDYSAAPYSPSDGSMDDEMARDFERFMLENENEYGGNQYG